MPAKLRVQLMDGDDARSGLPYIVVIDETIIEGVTDGDGWVEVWVPPRARHARLLVEVPPPELDPSAPGSQAGAAANEVVVDDEPPAAEVADDAEELPATDEPTIEEYELDLGALGTRATEVGARGRMVNLGLLDADADEDATREAIEHFQDRAGLTCSGELDDATAERLAHEHGS